MAASIEERNRILDLVEAGKVSAAQAAQLLDTLALEHEQVNPLAPTSRRFMRVRVTSLPGNRQKFNVIIPAGLISLGLRLGTRLVPQLSGSALEDLVRASEGGASGRLLDLQDIEAGERVEIFAE
jgi:SHOCT-like protein